MAIKMRVSMDEDINIKRRGGRWDPDKTRVNMECVWREDQDHWDTACGNAFEVTDGLPSENKMKYCCYCGKLLKEFPEEEEKC